MNISIGRPQAQDRDEIHRLFRAVITDAFVQDGIGFRHEHIEEEFERKLSFLDLDFKSNGEDIYFLIARTEEKIVGTIASGKPNELIKQNVKTNVENIPEITTVYVLPEFQGKGVGSALFQKIVGYLQQKNVSEAVLDGGFKKSQSFWMKKLGKPMIILKDHWGAGLDHMIWHVQLGDL